MSHDTRLPEEIELLRDTHSEGCRACQRGKWLCVFLTYKCNATCAFCPAPHKGKDRVATAFGANLQAVIDSVKDQDFAGISFSGGECFLVFDRLMEWLSLFKTQLPDLYYWVYTNGLVVDEEKLKRLTEAGLDEVRYNIAATGYSHPVVMDSIAAASALIPRVAVEVPSIPEDVERLMAVLPRLEEMKVRFLNLHEYILVPGAPSPGADMERHFLMNHEVELTYDARSAGNTERIREYCRREGLRIQVNNCTMAKKENQMRHRRRAMGRIHCRCYERLTEDGFLETLLVPPPGFCSAGLERSISEPGGFERYEPFFHHPCVYDAARQRTRGEMILRLSHLPPMALGDTRRLRRIEVLESG